MVAALTFIMLRTITGAVLVWIFRSLLPTSAHADELINHIIKFPFNFQLPLNNGTVSSCNSIRLLLNVKVILSE